MAFCKNCTGDFGHGMRCKNRGANLHVECDRYSEESMDYREFSCEDAIRDYETEKKQEKEENDKKDLEKANEGMNFIDLGEDNESK